MLLNLILNYHYAIYREYITSTISAINQEFLHYFSRNNIENVLENGFLTYIFKFCNSFSLILNIFFLLRNSSQWENNESSKISKAL